MGLLRVFNKAHMSIFRYGHYPLIYRLWVCEFFTKTTRIISISTNIYQPYVCYPLGSYILLGNNSLDPITFTNQPYKLTIKTFR